jgi:DMSO reductase anchor subunit
MRPAWSVILLTTLLGAGQGLFLALYAADLYGALSGSVAPGASFVVAGVGVAVAFAGGGLVASFFHLGHPERAWRSAAQWRTSWLSREVIALPLFMALAAAYGVSRWLGMPQGALAAGALAVAACFALFVCTGMIYACLKFLQEWASPLTVVNFILLGCASGIAAAAALAGWLEPALARPYGLAAIFAALLGAATRFAALLRNQGLRARSTLQTAIGVKHPAIAQKAQGAMGGSFNTREFFHGRAPALLGRVRAGFLLGAFAAPLLLLAAGWYGAAFCVQFTGLLAERWYFFAEARHPQNLYYQSIA